MGSYDAVVIGTSAGGVQALLQILPQLPSDFPVPVLAVIHLPPDRSNVLTSLVASQCKLTVKEAEDKETATGGVVYFAPTDYHLLVESNGDLALSYEEQVNYSRPSIDVLFQSAADTYRGRLMGILMTGANDDGARGLAAIAAQGGHTIIQDPVTAYARAMPEAGLKFCPTARIETLPGIVDQLRAIRP